MDVDVGHLLPACRVFFEWTEQRDWQSGQVHQDRRQSEIVRSRFVAIQFSQRFHNIWRADCDSPHDWRAKPVRLSARNPESTIHDPLPAFLYPERHLAIRVASFFRPVVESQSMLAGFDELHL